MMFPLRTQQHRVDTLAMKKVGIALGEDLLIRSMEERDYGVDAMVELFDGKSVGQMLFLQVKGTDSEIKPLVSNRGVVALGGFPRKTLLYAEQFVYPFIVAYTSVQQGAKDPSPVYFLWLQRHIERVLDVQEPDWRSDAQTTLTLHIPSKQIDPKEGLKKLALRAQCESQNMRLIRVYACMQVLAKHAMIGLPLTQENLSNLNWIIRELERCDRAIQVGDKQVENRFISELGSTKRHAQQTTDRWDMMLSRSFKELLSTMDDIVAVILVQGTYH